MEVLTKLNPRYLWYAGAGLLTVILVGLLIFLGISLLSPKKPGAPAAAVAAATAQATRGSQVATSTARTEVPDTLSTPVPPTPVPPTASAAAKPANPPAPAGVSPRPGVYVNRLTINPAQPPNGEPPDWYATFVNTSGAPVRYKWFIQIYSGQTNKRFGDTKWLNIDIPTGTNTLTAVQGWSVKVKGGCEPYYAQVEYFDDDGGRVPFRTTDGKIAAVSFNVCK